MEAHTIAHLRACLALMRSASRFARLLVSEVIAEQPARLPADCRGKTYRPLTETTL